MAEKETKKPVEEKPVKKEKKQKDEFWDSKPPREGRSLVGKIVNVVLWVILFAWMAVCVTDFILVKTEREPIFCFGEKTTTYSDGTVDSCYGAGYKVYNYKRESFKAIEFGPFWTKDRTAENK